MGRTIQALLAAAALVGSTFAAPAPQIAPEASPRAAARQERGGDAVDEARFLQRAARLLAARGYEADGRRLQQIVQEMQGASPAPEPAAPPSLEDRAGAVMGGDISRRETRVAVIQLVADAFGAEGWETKSAAMRWFANVGTPEGASAPVPEVLRTEGGAPMARIIEVLEEGSRLQARSGRRRVARAHMWLASFYREREGITRGRDRRGAPASARRELLARRAALEARIAEVQARLEETRAELERLKRRGERR